MKHIQRITGFGEPNHIRKLSDSSYYYNFDIKYEGEGQNPLKKEETLPIYSCIQVYIKGRVDYETIVKAVIRKHLNHDEEFDLINSYNSYLLGVSSVDASNEYKEYLALLDKIKKEVSQVVNK